LAIRLSIYEPNIILKQIGKSPVKFQLFEVALLNS